MRKHFREKERISLQTFLLRERIGHMENMLVTPDKPFSEIALSAGFDRDDSAGRAFKRVLGTTRREYARTKNAILFCLHETVA